MPAIFIPNPWKRRPRRSRGMAAGTIRPAAGRWVTGPFGGAGRRYHHRRYGWRHDSHILDEAGWRDPAQRFVLMPMTKIHELRTGLYQRGYEILQERAALAKGFAYTVMQVCWCGKRRDIADLFAWVGLLPQTRSKEALVYLKKQAATARNIAEGLGKSNTNRNEIDKYYKLANKIQKICSDWEEKR